MGLKFQFTHAIKRGLNVVFTEMADSRTNTMFLISNPFPLGFIMLFYYLFVVIIGPKIMVNRRPHELRKFYLMYNLVTAVLNLRMVYKGIGYFLFEYDFLCGPLQRSKDALSMELANYVHLHFLLKLFELSHTVLLTLSKRNRKPYHHFLRHSIFISVSWCCAKYYPGSHCILVAFVDSAITLIVHFIYLLINGVELYDVYWTWKKRIISIKLVHFQILFLHLLEQYVYGCNYSKYHLIFIIPACYFVTNGYVNFDHEDKLDEFFRLYREEPAPKLHKSNTESTKSK